MNRPSSALRSPSRLSASSGYLFVPSAQVRDRAGRFRTTLPISQQCRPSGEYEVESKLDRPIFHYEDGRIWAYILVIKEEGPLELWSKAVYVPTGRYHLVLVFNEKNILKKHSLIRFK